MRLLDLRLTLDKQSHAWAGVAIFGLAVAILPPLPALLVVAAAAVGKELWDSRTHPADWMDTASTIAGGMAAFFWTFGMGMLNGS